MYVVTISLTSKILIADITNPESTTFVSERSNGTDYPYLHDMTTISTFSIGDAAYAMMHRNQIAGFQFGKHHRACKSYTPNGLENGANYDLNSPAYCYNRCRWLNFCCNYITQYRCYDPNTWIILKCPYRFMPLRWICDYLSRYLA